MKKWFKQLMAILLTIATLVVAVPVPIHAEGNSIWDTIKDSTNQMSDAIREEADKAEDKALDMSAEIKNSFNNATGIAKKGLTNAYKTSSDYICSVVTQIDTKRFKSGWDTAAKMATSTLAAQSSAQYVKNVQDAIISTQTNIQNVTAGNGPLASRAGFVAEEWHTGTFNIDSVASGSDYSALRPASNAKASADVVVSKNGTAVQEVGIKYYKDGKLSAQAQAKTIMSNYKEYVAKETQKGNTSPLSFNEYLDKYVKLKDAYKIMDSEYASEYAGQTRLIPADQMDEAVSYLIKKTGKESAKEGANRKALAASYKDTLDNLADRITAKDGTASKPLSDDQARMIVELCDSGEFDIENFNITTSQAIKPKYILKQSISAGSQAAALEIALEVGPELFSVIAEGIRTGDIDEKQLKEVGIDAALAGANGFAEGAVSAAILSACQAGKFGSKMKNASPDIIGMLTVLTIDSIKHGYRLSKGEITAEQYGDIMAEEIFVAIMSQCSGAALAMVLPCFPFSYLVGSMIGGMIAAEGYKIGREVALQVAAGNGFEAIIPIFVNDSINIGKDTVAAIDIKKIGNGLKSATVTTTTAGLIKIKTLASK